MAPNNVTARFVEERKNLRKLLRGKSSQKIVEAAKDLFVKTFNPIYYFLLLQHSNPDYKDIDHSYLTGGCDPALSHYLLGSKFLYSNSMNDAKAEFKASLQHKAVQVQMPLYALEETSKTIRYIYKLIAVRRASESNIKILESYGRSPNIGKMKIEKITPKILNESENYFDEYNLYRGIPLDSFTRILNRVLPSGLALNRFTLESGVPNIEDVEVAFGKREWAPKSLLLFLMNARQYLSERKEEFSDDNYFYNQEPYREYFLRALKQGGAPLKEPLDFKNSSSWYGDLDQQSRKVHVRRINKEFLKSIKDPVVITNSVGKYSYMLAKKLAAKIFLDNPSL